MSGGIAPSLSGRGDLRKPAPYEKLPAVRALTRLAIILACLAVPAAALAITSSRVLAPNCNKAQYKPRELTLACNDGSYYLIKLKWTRWTTRTATGAGIRA